MASARAAPASATAIRARLTGRVFHPLSLAFAAVDYRVYHAVNAFTLHHPWLGRAFGDAETILPILIAVAALGLWLLARPGAERHWKLASASGLASAALALLVNRVVAAFWSRQRPYEAHHGAHVWVARSHDPSFPSDHASAAYGIAFAVLFFDRIVGALFLAAATLIAAGRVFVGAHYPADVLAGCVVGAACAVVVVRLARPLLAACVRVVERVTDPLVAPAWRRIGRR
jgi:undecaprenyl-diphosphatase